MNKHCPFPSINQFRHAIRDLKNRSCYVGKDDNGDPVYDWSKPLPKVLFEGTVKLHGTNAAIVLDLNTHEVYAQSREHVITPEKDNAGFARFVEDNKQVIKEMMKERVCIWSIKPNKLVVFGEWCGKGVFSNVGIGQLSKMFVVFGAKVIFDDEDGKWIEHDWIERPEINIYNIGRVPTYQAEVDLAYPEACLAKLEELTSQVGAECPFAKLFGATAENGPIIGEGIVWKPITDLDYRFAFKVKDEAHSKSKIKKLPTVDIEKLNGVKAFVAKHCHEDRMEQAYAATCSDPATAGMEKVGEFLRWLNQDVWKEEGDEAIGNNITQKEIGGEISKVAVKWFRDKLNKTL